MTAYAFWNNKGGVGKSFLCFVAATDKRLRPISHDQIQVYYNASLAAYVVAWYAYINALMRDFYNVIENPLDTKFHAVYTTAQVLAERSLERFNTPNAENTRNLFVHRV